MPSSPRQRLPASWTEYEGGGRQDSHDSALSYNRVTFDPESQQHRDSADDDHLHAPNGSDGQQDLRRRRSSMAMRVNALRQAGGVNSLDK